MKITILLVVTFCLGAKGSVYSQSVNLSVKEARLEYTLEAIGKQTHYRLLYDYELVDAAAPITVDLQNADLETALKRVLRGRNLTYQIISGTIAIMERKPTDRVVEGTVSDSTGVLRGVTVSVEGLGGSGAVTDQYGKYRIRVGEDATLLFRMIGYEDQRIVVSNTETINVTMVAVSSRLDEVVVVGYGAQRKRDITGTVSSVPKDRLEMIPNLNIGQALQGTVPGVVFSQTNGGAAPSGEIMVRGRNSILASNAPLIILDGVPFGGQLMDINITDVASIEVLKDASSAAIYGSRGANGVILVTTKKGTSGVAGITYDGKYASQQPNLMPRYMTAPEFFQFKEIREPGKFTASEQQLYDTQRWTDWADLAIRNGSSHQHNLSVSGGMKDTRYYLSGGYLNVKGQTVNNTYERVSSRINVETKVANLITLGTNTQLTFDDRGQAPINWGTVFATNPLTSAYDEVGNLTIYPWPEFIDIGNPLAPLNYTHMDKSFQLVTNNFAQISIIDGLEFRVNNGIRKRLDDYGSYLGRNTSDGVSERGIANTSRGVADNILLEQLLTYKKDWGKHQLFGTALYSYEKNSTSQHSLEASGFPHDFLGWYSVGQADFTLPAFSYNQTTLISQMLRLNYSYHSRYLLTLTGRRDGFSGFGTDNKWGLFPSLAIGWNIAEESFFSQLKAVDELKLRVSYGSNGNQAVGAYESISRLGEQNNITGSTSLPGYVPIKIGQSNLGWETSRTFNAGLDFSLFKSKLSGSLNVYHTHTFDLLLNRTISPVHGITSITQNIGKTANRGTELSINATVIDQADFRWAISGNFAANRNKILSLYGIRDAQGNETDDLANAWFIGKPILVNYDFRFAGVWQLDEAEEAALWDAEPGYAKNIDVDGSRTRNDADRMIIGQLDPKTTWGLSNTWTYRDLGLSVFMHGVHGVTKENQLLQDASASSEVRRNVIKKNWWTPDNPTNEFYKNAVNVQAVPIYEDAGFIRIKDITLFYNLPNHVAKAVGLSGLRIYTVGRNLFTFTNWSASDPELNFGRGSAPLAKEFVFGLTINL